MSTRVTSDITIDRHGRKLRRMSFEQRAQLRRSYRANTSRWRHPLIGFLISVPLVGGTTLGLNTLSEYLRAPSFFPSAFMLLPVLFLALFWGVGPALLSLVLSTLALDYYFVQPGGQFTIDIREGLVQLVPFVISGLIIAVIIAQRERARLNALAAEQELQSYAQYLEEVNRKLEDANHAKDRFISIASHELKTPITTIRGQAQLAMRRLSKQGELSSEEESLLKTLERINDQTRRLTLLIDDLLDVSSMRTGKIELVRKLYDLREVCRDVVEDQRLLTGRTIRLDMPVTPIRTYLDHDRLAQVLVNLVSNAVKYSPDNMPVDVRIECVDGKVMMRVRDYGKGISPDQRERIFESFYRTPEAEASSARGLGLGLAIAREIVERHSGHIRCESEAGQGSMFIVELPLKG
ncbi:MAG: HAMP domain-containing histidine kinase [Ktedonobacteraceae bacterium]|nr:HAMP domain-containing histidine kinase [Ktedonobacteraceae bacterium]MBO0792261.1 HAMP domain-containing histidine kinase [Ktedonobacteraceae bacterium]